MDPIMKKIFKYILVAFAALSLGSCTSLLDQEPLDSFTDEAVLILQFRTATLTSRLGVKTTKNCALIKVRLGANDYS